MTIWSQAQLVKNLNSNHHKTQIETLSMEEASNRTWLSVAPKLRFWEGTAAAQKFPPKNNSGCQKVQFPG